VKVLLRADSGFARDELMTWCEARRVDYVFGLARHERLVGPSPTISPRWRWRVWLRAVPSAASPTSPAWPPARGWGPVPQPGGQALDSWSRACRVVAKAEHLPKGSNPRFVLTSLAADQIDARTLYEDIYCARGEVENRIKEQQLDLFADRTSAATMRANQIRLWFASFAYVLLDALRRIGLRHTQFAAATCGTIRLKLLKIGAQVRLSVRRIKIHGLGLPLSDRVPPRLSLPEARRRLLNESSRAGLGAPSAALVQNPPLSARPGPTAAQRLLCSVPTAKPRPRLPRVRNPG
jgi:hypothetical protein